MRIAKLLIAPVFISSVVLTIGFPVLAQEASEQALPASPKPRLELDSFPMEAIKVAVAANPQTPKETLAQLAKSRDGFVRRALAGNPAISEEIKDLLAQDQDQMVLEALLRNPRLPAASILQKLTENGQPRLKETLAANGNTPAPILTKLSQGPQ